jgi:hypothetical protein
MTESTDNQGFLFHTQLSSQQEASVAAVATPAIRTIQQIFTTRISERRRRSRAQRARNDSRPGEPL